MESLYLLIPLSVLLIFVVGAIFWWSVKGGQFDDLEGPAYRILHDDDAPQKERPNGDGIQKTQDSSSDER
ncbi:cytochrome oxidase maturation protein, cbb3-type [Andreprevotia lacus DSM 23236]|jgi:cbb3-type cytochrome oxidase maturation protein|uniref:Cytochrome oxidase maturation protein, cbb3-type n=1 Tax=Andreprevotia lacus DSM 23236 TaxID=1121001 RepID=A0A1W1XDZ1_9NEIS|nr:cbb3-type cytochrome oxidase assembly protein CcoS [Andreprevotia lacus]SMC22113.1 cytochrome oxidase maturation protein, cbb3-type [Andreprevotia lacus DSM 23236]